jgi:hypothetical protein
MNTWVSYRAGWVVASVISSALLSAAGAPADLTIGDVRVVEGDVGERSVDVPVVLSQAAAGPVTVAYTTRDGTAAAGSDYRAASGTVTFTKGETTKRITIKVVGETEVETDETFDVVLSSASGATLADGTATATIINDDFARIPPGGARGPSVYEVRLSWTGSTGAFEGAIGCPVRPNGRAVLTGLVSGVDKVPADEDIDYTGTLHYDVDVDLCEIRRNAAGEDEFCAITVVGSGPLKVELKVYEGDRGGYIQTTAAPTGWSKSVTGSCEGALISSERSAFPDKSMANMFDGTELPLPSGPLRVGPYRDGRLLVEVLRAVR